MATARVPLLDLTGHLPESYAPPSVALDAATATTQAGIASAAASAATDALNAATGLAGNPVAIPDEYALSGVSVSVTRHAPGWYSTNANPESLWTGPGTIDYYVDIVNGNDSNNGLSAGAAFKRASTAYAKSDVRSIIFAAGWYDYQSYAGAITKSIKLKAAPGAAVYIYYGQSSTAYTPLTWTLHDAGTYVTSRTNVNRVWDLTDTQADGSYTRLTLAASAAACVSTPGSWYFSTPTLYVHTKDGRVPDTNVKVSLVGFPLSVTGLINVYCEGLTFIFGKNSKVAADTGTAQRPNFYAKNCRFLYSEYDDGLTVAGASKVLLQGCEAAYNYSDGFSYAASPYGGESGQVLEVDCLGHHNGVDLAGTNNGSTAHQATKVIRVGGRYYRNDGPNVSDVDTCTSLNVGCLCYGSTTAIGNKSDFTPGSASARMMLLDCRTGPGSTYSAYIQSGASLSIKEGIISGTISGTPVWL